MLESKIEAYLTKKVKEHNGLCYKWASPNNRGVPDRVVFLNKQVWFVELKSEKGKLSKLQEHTLSKISEFTDNVAVIYSIADVDNWLKDVLY